MNKERIIKDNNDNHLMKIYKENIAGSDLSISFDMLSAISVEVTIDGNSRRKTFDDIKKGEQFYEHMKNISYATQFINMMEVR